MIEQKKLDGSIYLDYKTGNVIVSKKGDNDSYSFYATKLGESRNISDVDFSNLQPIEDIFDYIQKNDFDMATFSKEITAASEKKHGK